MMCLAVPMELVVRDGLDGVAELRGVRRRVSLVMCPEVRVGEHVLVHAGYAIGVLDEEEARRTLELLASVQEQEPPR
jgi:hydrogenase expression/formation protein HypC